MSTPTETQSTRERGWIFITALVLLGGFLLYTKEYTRYRNRFQELTLVSIHV